MGRRPKVLIREKSAGRGVKMLRWSVFTGETLAGGVPDAAGAAFIQPFFDRQIGLLHKKCRG